MQQGERIKLYGADGNITRLLVSLGWDEAKRESGVIGFLKGKPKPVDCDLSVVLCGRDGKLILDSQECIIYYDYPSHSSGAVLHLGDNETGENEEGEVFDDEQVIVKLDLLPEEVAKLVFVVNLHDGKKRGQDFSHVENCFVQFSRLGDSSNLCCLELSGDSFAGMTGVIVGELAKGKDGWELELLGTPLKDASSLDQIVDYFI